jgi:hypothetical protein
MLIQTNGENVYGPRTAKLTCDFFANIAQTTGGIHMTFFESLIAIGLAVAEIIGVRQTNRHPFIYILAVPRMRCNA